ASGEKPQSKLWYNDGRWWGDLVHSDGKHYIFYLDQATQTWVKTNTTLDTRTATKSDCLWDGTYLYVASGGGKASTGTDLDAVLYRYHYDSASKTYVQDFGPVTIRTGGAETLVLDKDSTGQLWITYTKSSTVYVNRSQGSDSSWVAADAFVMPTTGGTNPNVSSDDISTLISFANTIVVVWSNQSTGAFYYSVHSDSNADDKAWAGGVIAQSSGLADDHMNLKLQATDNRVFAVVKTTSNSGEIRLFSRSTSGSWSNTLVTAGSANQTRPIILVDSTNNRLYIFHSDEGGGVVYYKQSDASTINFGSTTSKGTAFISSATYKEIDNSTSTKQDVNNTTGIVILASDDTAKWYLHNYLSLGGSTPTPPTANFSASPTSGSAPLAVQFSDTSTGSPTSWQWDFDNNGSTDSTAQNPSFSYTTAGTYSVKLTVANAGGSNATTKSG
ncbi:MAG TPA: PKD domain-containing protein, partial [Roseiflexaceae bacterium]|nr:PKD domain-containing protein [Roseiflexaceae bacterium]